MSRNICIRPPIRLRVLHVCVAFCCVSYKRHKKGGRKICCNPHVRSHHIRPPIRLLCMCVTYLCVHVCCMCMCTCICHLVCARMRLRECSDRPYICCACVSVCMCSDRPCIGLLHVCSDRPYVCIYLTAHTFACVCAPTARPYVFSHCTYMCAWLKLF